MLAALADHDDVLADQIEQARRALGRLGRVGQAGRGRLIVDVPGMSAAELAASVWLTAVTRLGSTWARGLGALEAFVAEHGHARVLQTHRMDDGFALGGWVTYRRQDRKHGRLTDEQIAELDALGLVWDPHAEDFVQGLSALQSFVAAEGHAEVPQKHRTEEGFALGRWVSKRRQEGRNGRLTGEQVAALDGVGFVWDQDAVDFARGVAALTEFVNAEGHADVRQRHRTEEGFALGRWVSKRRQEGRNGRLTGEQVAALEGVGLIWGPRAANFARGLAALKAYVAEADHAKVPATHQTEDGFTLGSWVRARRRDGKEGRLTGEQVAALDGLGFVWDPFGEEFARGLATLKAFVAESDHARVPVEHQTRTGSPSAGGCPTGGWTAGRGG